MALKDWKISKYHGTAQTKMAWEKKNGDHLELRYIPTMSIPYRLVLNGYKDVDSSNSKARIMKLATNWRKNN